MNQERIGLRHAPGCVVALFFAAALLFVKAPSAAAQVPAAAAAPSTPAQLEVLSGTTAGYRVREQLAGLNFPDDAEGSTDGVTGTLVILPDGSVDSARSKLTIDLRNLKSDQDMRDGYVKSRTLETDKFPTAEFVAKRLQGVPSPPPGSGPSQRPNGVPASRRSHRPWRDQGSDFEWLCHLQQGSGGWPRDDGLYVFHIRANQAVARALAERGRQNRPGNKLQAEKNELIFPAFCQAVSRLNPGS